MAFTTCVVVWLHWLLVYLGVKFTHPTPLYCDNKGTVYTAHNSIIHERNKHIEIDYHNPPQFVVGYHPLNLCLFFTSNNRFFY